MSIFKVISLLNIAIFLGLIFFSKRNKNNIYLNQILFSFPFLSLKIFPLMDGFTLISYLFFFFFYKPRTSDLQWGRQTRWLIIPLSLFILTGFFASALGPCEDGLRDLIRIFPFFIFAKVFIEECEYDDSFFYQSINALKLVLYFSFFFLCIQFVKGVEFSLSKTINPNIAIKDGFRYPSFFGDPQDYSLFLAVLAFLCLIKKREASKFAASQYLVVVLCVLGMLTAGGRAGLMGFLLGLFIYIMFGNTKMKLLMTGIGTAFYFIVMNFQEHFAIFKRGTAMDDTYDFRHGLWMQAYQMFLDSPIWGIGIGNYARHVEIHNPDQFWMVGKNEYIIFDIPESGYFKLLSELGGPAFLLIFILLLTPMISGFFKYFVYKDLTLILLISAFASWLISFNSNYSFSDTRIELLVTVLICYQIVYQGMLKKEEEPESDDYETADVEAQTVTT